MWTLWRWGNDLASPSHHFASHYHSGTNDDYLDDDYYHDNDDYYDYHDDHNSRS